LARIDERPQPRIETSRGPVAAAITLGSLFAVLLIAFVAGTFVLRSTFGETRALRTTEIARAQLLSLQLDEETGIRGYVAARNPVFLQPYYAATAQFPAALARFEHAAVHAHVNDAAQRAAQLGAYNALWQREMAQPLLRNAAPADQTAIALRGKGIVDRYRRADETLRNEIGRDADLAEQRTTISLMTIALYLFLGILAIGIIIVLVSRAQQRLRLEYERNAAQLRATQLVADALQQALLPGTLPCDHTVCFDATYRPASEIAQVGGDWYDAIALEDGRFLFSLGDVAGHGIASAVVMSRVRQAILALATEEDDPARLLRQTNRALHLQGADMMVTAICGFYDPRTRTITYATAGHPAPIIWSQAHGARLLPRGGMALGVDDEMPLETFTHPIEPGTLLVLYTDGLLEYARDFEAGEKRLLAVVDAMGSSLDHRPASEIATRALAGARAPDDIAVLTARFAT
jgi:serine phosphatase RsbU (regulator of sigma subunit)